MGNNYRVIRSAPKPPQREFSKLSLDEAWNLIESAQRIELMLFCLEGILDWRCVSEDKEIGRTELTLMQRRLEGWLKHCKSRLRKDLLGAEHPPRWLFEALRQAKMDVATDRFKRRK